MRSSVARVGALSLALVAAFGTPGTASAQATGFGDTVDVQLINVEVWVTDGKGRPVTGLGVEDFEIREDGERVPISHFAEVRGLVPAEPAAPQALAEPRGSVIATERSPGHLVLYFDQLNLRPASRNRVIDDLRRFLDSESVPAERILVLRQDSDLYTEAPFGSSRSEVEAAFDRIAAATGSVVGSEIERSLAIGRLQQLWEHAQLISSSPCGIFLLRAAPEVDLYSRQRRAKIQVTLGHLQRTASFLAGVSGLKTLIYVSDTLETDPGTDLLALVDGLCPGQREITRFDLAGELSDPFRHVTRNANANRVTFYSLQAEGLRGDFLTSPSQQTIDPIATRSFDSTLRQSQRAGLSYLAGETGGRTIINRNRFGDELDAIADEMTAYYSLAYSPPHGGDRAEHRIDVRVDGMRVRHRRGYRDKGPDEQMADRLESALYLGLMSNPLAARLGAGTVREAEGGFNLPLHVLVPAGRVAFLPVAEKFVAQLTLQVAACDERNRNVVFEQKKFRFDQASGEPPEGAMLDLAIDLELDGGAYVVAVALRDEATRETSYVSTTLEVGTQGKRRAARR